MRQSIQIAAVMLLGLAACGPGACGGCFRAPAGPLPESERVYEGLQVRITPQGFAAGAGNMATALTAVAPGYVSFTLQPVPIASRDFDGTLCPSTCFMSTYLDSPTVDRAPPDKLLLKSSFHVSRSMPFSGQPQCNIDLDLNATAEIELQLTREPETNHVSVKVTQVRVPIAPADVTVSSTNCGAVDYTPIVDAIVALSPLIEQEILSRTTNPARQQFCLRCNDYLDGCPAGSTCGFSNYCEWPDGRCVARPLGIFGTFDLREIAPGNYRESTAFEFHMAGAQTGDLVSDTVIDPSTGADFRFYGGVLASEITPDCVPQGLPPIEFSERVDLDAEAEVLAETDPALADGYHLGFVLTEAVMSRILQGAWASGAFCVQATPAISNLLSAASLSAVLPSIGLLADDDAPAILQLRLKEPPVATAGAGEYGLDEQGKRVLLKPLLTADLKGLELSIYTVVEGRYVRVLGIDANARLPLGVEQVPNANGTPTLLAVLGDLTQLADDVTVTHRELLAEDDETIRASVRTLLSLAQPVVESTLESFALPSADGLQLELLAAHGVNRGLEPDDYRAIGVFLNVSRVSKMSQPVKTDARLIELRDPAPGAERVVAKIFAGGHGEGAHEFQYRVDGGLWSAFHPAGELEIDHPRLALRGSHLIEVRARQQGAWASLDPAPVALRFEVTRPKPVFEPKTRELGPELLEELGTTSTPHAAGGCGMPGGALPIFSPLLLALAVRRRR